MGKQANSVLIFSFFNDELNKFGVKCILIIPECTESIWSYAYM
jgi:hypothetical protein